MKNLMLKEGNFRWIVFVLALTIGLALSASAQTGVKGKVRANSGAGITDATVTITQSGKDVKSVRSAADGSFRLEGIQPGIYGLRVEADGFATGSLLAVEVKKDKVRDLGERLFLKVDEGTQVIIRGSVFFREGTSVTAAKVELERIDSDGTARRIGKTESSVSGEFVFRQPDTPAKLRVTATYKGVSGSKEITVENAAVYRLAISLDLSSSDK